MSLRTGGIYKALSLFILHGLQVITLRNAHNRVSFRSQNISSSNLSYCRRVERDIDYRDALRICTGRGGNSGRRNSYLRRMSKRSGLR